MSELYDQLDPKSIEVFGKRLLNNTLRTTTGCLPVPEESLDLVTGGSTRGSFGTILEKYYFGITPGNESEPDFRMAKVELKATPLKLLRTGLYSAKERLVLNMINYRKEAELDFTTSSFMHKNAQIMLVSYLHLDGEKLGDYPVKIAKLIRFSDLPEEDRKIIQEDWNKIVEKIKDCRAHELSEGDTLYLGACTKGANSTVMTPQCGGGEAKPRAFSFKGGYMTTLARRELMPTSLSEMEAVVKDPKDLDWLSFEALVISKLKPFVGKKTQELQQQIGEGLNSNSKDYFAALARRMLGVKKQKVEELEKAEIIMKTVRLNKKGRPKESMSFPAFKYKELAGEVWEESTLIEQLSKRFLFFVYQYDEQGELYFRGAKFWTMPTSKLSGNVKLVWDQTVDKIKQSKASELTRESVDMTIHVRPHSRNAEDTDVLPDGSLAIKKSFWINKNYLQSILENLGF